MTPWTVTHQASLSFTISQSLLKLMSIESVMPSNHLTLCRPLLLLSSVFASIRVFSNELSPPIRWPEYWRFSLSISPSSEYSGLIPLGLTALISLHINMTFCHIKRLKKYFNSIYNLFVFLYSAVSQCLSLPVFLVGCWTVVY